MSARGTCGACGGTGSLPCGCDESDPAVAERRGRLVAALAALVEEHGAEDVLWGASVAAEDAGTDPTYVFDDPALAGRRVAVRLSSLRGLAVGAGAVWVGEGQTIERAS